MSNKIRRLLTLACGVAPLVAVSAHADTSPFSALDVIRDAGVGIYSPQLTLPPAGLVLPARDSLPLPPSQFQCRRDPAHPLGHAMVCRTYPAQPRSEAVTCRRDPTRPLYGTIVCRPDVP